MILGAYFLHFKYPCSKEIDFFIAIIGTSFTILGLAVAFDQIMQTRSKTEETQKAVEDTINRLQTLTKAFSITDAIRLAEVTEEYLREKLPGESRIKLQEFSQLLIGINDEELKRTSEQDSQRITRQMQLIKVDINNLNKTKSECRDIDWSTIITHVEDAKNVLAEHFSKINKKV